MKNKQMQLWLSALSISWFICYSMHASKYLLACWKGGVKLWCKASVHEYPPYIFHSYAYDVHLHHDRNNTIIAWCTDSTPSLPFPPLSSAPLPCTTCMPGGLTVEVNECWPSFISATTGLPWHQSIHQNPLLTCYACNPTATNKYLPAVHASFILLQIHRH